jgi:hypothetical protein
VTQDRPEVLDMWQASPSLSSGTWRNMILGLANGVSSVKMYRMALIFRKIRVIQLLFSKSSGGHFHLRNCKKCLHSVLDYLQGRRVISPGKYPSKLYDSII